MNDRDWDFLKQQYTALRDEIRDSQDRRFKTMGAGLFIIPSADALADRFQIGALKFAVPFLIIVVALLYLSQTNTVMRCGTYIREEIEHKFALMGWEEWLEKPSKSNHRSVDKYLSYAFYLLFVVYFLGALFVAWRPLYNFIKRSSLDRFIAPDYMMSFKMIKAVIAADVMVVYAAIGIWCTYFLFKHFRVSTLE